MELGVVFVWIGAGLVIAGLLLTAARALGRGRLSEPRPPRAGPDTLEPRGGSARLSLSGSAPGLALAAVGGLLLVVGAMM